MTRAALTSEDRKQWGMAGAIALVAHVAIGGLVLAWVRPTEPVIPEPVVLIELPPEAAAAPAVATTQSASQPREEYVPPQVQMKQMQVPEVRAALPKDPVSLPPPPMQPRSVDVAVPPIAPAAVTSTIATRTGMGTGSSSTAGDDPKARQREADYFALVSAHLNRRKTYPVEARQARQQGIVTVRFTVDRNGNVSNISIKRTSGHEILDQATMNLVQRVAPLPRMPASMQRESITLSLPIDYSLRTN